MNDDREVTRTARRARTRRRFPLNTPSRGCVALGRIPLSTRVMSAAVAHGAPDVSGVVDLDLLQGELDAARGRVEMWCAQRELSMKEAVAAHKTNMMESEEQYVRLVEKEKDLAASGEEAQRRKEYERGELEALREEAAQAKELGEGLPQQLQALREQVRREEQELEGNVRALEGEEAVERRTLDAHLTAVAAYGDRLGLRFEIGDAEDFREFFFRNVDPNAHAREFMVAVRVRASGGYELVDADPDVEALTALLEECNASDNLSKFVRGARALSENSSPPTGAGGGGARRRGGKEDAPSPGGGAGAGTYATAGAGGGHGSPVRRRRRGRNTSRVD